MSDEITTNETPNAEAGGNSGTTPAAQPAAQPATATVQTPGPFRTFGTEADLQEFVRKSKTQAERAALRKLASELGFEDAEELKEALIPLRKGQTPAVQTPAVEPQGSAEADRLRMALTVGARLNLPAVLVGRLQGATAEEMEADAQLLLGYMQQPAAVIPPAPRSPGIPPAPQQNAPVTFTRAQLQDAAFVRQHAAEIREAARTGRIVSS